ncbi:MAG: flavodoxin-dependent (E)-4-hydroxy-3-methylbut-2-enyl-diphosphate synthase, partial [Kiritimatiellae bacterium]|nr:flavodoxin-dependent (E)-4-hydroxy-3-methylbut-2-enyl-diphosphate synthase [Kiritimatiellia bacterium]
DTPEREVAVGLEILRALGLRPPGPSVTSCPTCGRTKCDVKGVAEAVEAGLARLSSEVARRELMFPRVAVMGCVVNGPGEAKGADIALCGGDGVFLLYENGELLGKIQEQEAVGAVLSSVCRKLGIAGVV